MSGGDSTASEVVQDLVRRAQSGERAAQQALVLRYGYLIRRAVRGRLGDGLRGREETADLEQLATLEVLRSLEGQRWQGKRAFLAWLKRVATGEVIDRARYHHAERRASHREAALDEVRAPLAAAAPSLESQVDVGRRLAELERLLDALPEKQAKAVLLFHHGHSHAEIGAVLECTAEAARKLVARGHAKLTTLAAELVK